MSKPDRIITIIKFAACLLAAVLVMLFFAPAKKVEQPLPTACYVHGAIMS